MPNTFFISWVKNVYSLGMRTGITSVLLPTSPTLFSTYPQTRVYKPLLSPPVIPALPMMISTVFFIKIPLLFSYLYPFSTPLITIETKEN